MFEFEEKPVSLATTIGRLLAVLAFVQIRFMVLMLTGWVGGSVAGYIWPETMQRGLTMVGADMMSPAAFGAFICFVAAAFPRGSGN